MCQPKEYDQIANAFKQIDNDCSGFIDVAELRKVLVEANFSKVMS
jgi:Ca2+-binding EF-hand superfamily protein